MKAQCVNIYTIFTQMQDKISSLNFLLKYVRSTYICIWSTEPDRAKLECSEPDHAQPNQGVHNQIIKWDLHSSEILHRTEQ